MIEQKQPMNPGMERSLAGTIFEFSAVIFTLFMKPDPKIHWSKQHAINFPVGVLLRL